MTELILDTPSKVYKTEPLDQNLTDLSFSFTRSNSKPKLSEEINEFENHPKIRPPLTGKCNITKHFNIPIIRTEGSILDSQSTPRQRLQDYKQKLGILRNQNQQQRVSQEIVFEKLQKQLCGNTNSKQVDLLLKAYNELQMSHSKLQSQFKIVNRELQQWKTKYQELEKYSQCSSKSETKLKHLKTTSLTLDKLRQEIYHKMRNSLKQ